MERGLSRREFIGTEARRHPTIVKKPVTGFSVGPRVTGFRQRGDGVLAQGVYEGDESLGEPCFPKRAEPTSWVAHNMPAPSIRTTPVAPGCLWERGTPLPAGKIVSHPYYRLSAKR